MPDTGDPAIWTVIGEAGSDPDGQRAVASTITNRLNASGAASPAAVVTDPANGYEAWQSTGARNATLARAPVNSALYQATLQNVGPILAGQAPAPYGFDSFYSPAAQSAMGRKPPSWDDGTGVMIGGNRFFAGKYKGSAAMPSQDDVEAAWAHQSGAAPSPSGASAVAGPAAPSDADISAAYAAQAAPAPHPPLGDGAVTLGPKGATAPPAVEGAVRKLMASGQFDQTQPQGSSANPYIQGPDFPPAPDGAATIDMAGNYTPAKPSPSPGLGQELIAGGAKAITGLPDALQGALGNGPSGIMAAEYRAMLLNTPDFIAQAKSMGMDPNAAADLAIQQHFGSQGHFDSGLGAVTGYNPENVPATTPTQRLQQAVGGGIASAFIPMGAEAKGAGLVEGGLNAARNAFTGAVGGASSQLASDAAPGPLKPLASVVGGIGGAVLAHHVPNAFSAVVEAPRPFMAAFSDPATPNGAANAGAGAQLANAAENPAALKASVAGGAQEIVPGSRPTTFQQSGDLGIGAAEKAMANIAPEPFREQAATQNAARVQALQGVQTGGDPGAVAQAVTKQFDDITAQHDAAIQTAIQTAQSKAATIGGDATPDVYGADIRAAAVQADAAARAREGQLWDAIDPDRSLAGNAAPTKAGLAAIQAEMRPTTTPMSAAEAHVFQVASELPDVTPVQDLLELKKQLGALQGAELQANGRSPAYARLSRAYGIVSDNLSNSISDAVSSQQAQVAAGQLAPDATIEANVRGWVSKWGQRTQAVAASDGGGSAGGGGSAQVGVAAPAGLSGAASEAGGQAGGTSGNPSVPGQPAVDPGLAGRITAANAASRERFQTFGVSPLDVILDKEGGGGFKVQNGGVAAKAFHPGPMGFDDTTALLKAAPAALPAVQDYAAMSLRRAAMNPDGTLDPNRFAGWSKANADSIRALPPETASRFADAAAASQTVGDAAVAKAGAIRAYQQGAVARLLKVSDPEDVTKTVGAVFNRPSAASEMSNLASTVADDPAAKQGLRQAVADYIANKFVSNTEAATSGENTMKSDPFQGFVRGNKAALSAVFSPEEIQTMRDISDDLHRSARSASALKTAGSDTALNQNLGARIVSTLKHHGAGLMTGLVAGVAGAHGAHGLGMEALEGIGSAIGIGVPVTIASAWRGAGVARINDVFRQALLDPDVAKALLAKLPESALNDSKALGSAKARLFQALAKSTGVAAGANNAQATTPQPKPPVIGLRNAFAPMPGTNPPAGGAQNAYGAPSPAM